MASGKRYKAAVIGGSGYGGAEMIRRLLVHPDVELVRVASIDFVGEPLSAANPALEGLTDLRFEKITPAEAAQGMDAVLLGLPHTVTAEKVPEIAAVPGVKVVDMSGDFRLKSADSYERWYKHEHPCPERLADFVYGLPELNREAIRKARFVASPGCFATTMELALLPLAKAGLLEGVVHVQGITGSSGSGVAPSAGTHHPI
ncbi:MAG TPA: N-acetyl-gamma-glutamyl-phosphate reductase, partial [Anaeromyxobacteraceae bacterium]|nr:N-acetyl-gamma-glutamyl-phosphate reductase [Anaeromyxobacteraceae bacterium]